MAVRYQYTTKTGEPVKDICKDLKVEILDSEFSGTITDLVALPPAVTISYDSSGDVDIFDPVKASHCVLLIHVDKLDLFNFIVSIGRSNPFRFGVKVYLDNVLQWTGYIKPEQINIPYKCKTDFEAEIVATDSISSLTYIDYSSVINSQSWLQYFTPLYKDATDYRQGLSFYDLTSTLSYHIVYVGQLVEARQSRYYNNFIDCLRASYDETDDINLFEFFTELFNELNVRIAQVNGVIYIVEIDALIGATSISGTAFNYNNTTDLFEFHSLVSVDIEHIATNVAYADVQYLPGVNTVKTEFTRDNTTDTYTAENETKQINVKTTDVNRLSQLTTNNPTYSGLDHLSYGGFMWLNTSGSYGFIPLNIGTWLYNHQDSYYDLIQNGQFTSSSTTGITANNMGMTAASGSLSVICIDSGGDGALVMNVACTIGETYLVTCEQSQRDSGLNQTFFGVGTANSAANWDDVASATLSALGIYNLIFVATQTTHYITFSHINTINTKRYKVSNVKCYDVDNLKALEQLNADQRANIQYYPGELFKGKLYDHFNFLNSIVIDGAVYMPNRLDIISGTDTITGEWFKLWEYLPSYWVDYNTSVIEVDNDGELIQEIQKKAGQASQWGHLAFTEAKINGRKSGVQFSINGTDVDYLAAAGLDAKTGSPQAYLDFDFCIVIDGSTGVDNLKIYEYGNLKHQENYTLEREDIFRIEYTDRFITYIKNGSTIYQSLNAAVFPLYGAADFYSAGSGFYSLKLYGNNLEA